MPQVKDKSLVKKVHKTLEQEIYKIFENCYASVIRKHIVGTIQSRIDEAIASLNFKEILVSRLEEKIDAALNRIDIGGQTIPEYVRAVISHLEKISDDEIDGILDLTK